MLNSVVKISMTSAKYFEYYTIILRGAVFLVDTLYLGVDWLRCVTNDAYVHPRNILTD